MIYADKVKDLRLYGESLILPEGIVVLLSKDHLSLNRVLATTLFIDRGKKFHHVYQNRDIVIDFNNKKVIQRGTSIRSDYYRFIKGGSGLNGIISIKENHNCYYDTYRENKLFFDNVSSLSPDKISNLYIKLLKENILGSSIMNNYENKIILVNIREWEDDENSPPIVFLHAINRMLNKFISIGDIDVVFFNYDGFFKFKFSKINKSNKGRLLKLTSILFHLNHRPASLIDEIKGEIEEEDGEVVEVVEEPEVPDTKEEEEDIEKISDIDSVLEPVNINKTAISKRDKELREKQKQIKLNNIKLDNIYDRDMTNADIPINDVSGSVNTLNQEITQVRFPQYHEVYNEKLYQRDILSIMDSMKDKTIPVYIRDVSREDTSNSLNKKYTYTFHLEDAQRGRHTLKFDVPKFIQGKYMYLNGNKKMFNNQRIAKPLIKISPDTVEVVTNYNKIFMRRHGEKVEALYEKFKELVLTDTKHFSYKKGDCSRINSSFKTSIEYDTFAKEFSSIIVNKELYLIFNQHKLRELCKEYGMTDEYEKIPEDKFPAGYFLKNGKYKLFTLDL